MVVQKNKIYRVLFSGGGTLGPVIPLLAVWDQLRTRTDITIEGIWVATPHGPEQAILEKENLRVYSLRAPKLRRYFSFSTLLMPVLLVTSFFHAWYILRKERPHVLLTAGGFTSVPLHLVAKLLRIPTLVHQQDVLPGIANRIIAPIASSVTCAFAATAKKWSAVKPLVIGNPVRADVLHGSREEACRLFQLEPQVPTVLVLGGGTGAQQLNALMYAVLPRLVADVQIIHSTGVGKFPDAVFVHPRYHAFPFIARADLAHAYAAADIVISRAGMGTISELSAIRKQTLLAPIQGSHQEANARVVVDAGAAQLCAATPDALIAQIRSCIAGEVAFSKQDRWASVLRVDAAMRLSSMVLYILARTQ